MPTAHGSGRSAVLESGCWQHVVGRGGRLRRRGRRRGEAAGSLAARHNPAAALRCRGTRGEAERARCREGSFRRSRLARSRGSGAIGRRSPLPLVAGGVRLGGSDRERMEGSGDLFDLAESVEALDPACEELRVRAQATPGVSAGDLLHSYPHDRKAGGALKFPMSSDPVCLGNAGRRECAAVRCGRQACSDSGTEQARGWSVDIGLGRTG